MARKTKEDEAELYEGHNHSTVESDLVAHVGTDDQNSSRRKCVVVLLSVALIAVLLAIIIPVTLNLQNRNTSNSSASSKNAAVNEACAASQYPQTCSATLQNSTVANAKIFTQTTVQAALDGVDYSLLAVENAETPQNSAAVQVCIEALDTAQAELTAILVALNTSDPTALQAAFDDLKVRLTAAMEFHTTCADALKEVNAPISLAVQATLEHTNELFSVALSFLNAFAAYGDNFVAWAKSAGLDLSQLGINRRRRRLLQEKEGHDKVDEVPDWVGNDHRRLLLQVEPLLFPINTIVAPAGGNFKRIMDAVKQVPKKSTKVYVIYIKTGTYKEQVIIPSSLTNIMFIGDGQGKTIITGSLSVALTFNMTTYLSPTLIVGGQGFFMRDITVQNTAGPNGQQAVAMRVSADNTAFYHCTFDGFQDTLYAHNYRQYYRECIISGTVDYIFGNAWVVIQNSRMIAKKSGLVGQQVTYTAQGKTDKGMTTALSFQDCTFEATTDLISNVAIYKSYLGRPWKPYSTCVLLRCNIGGHVDPTGWLPWNTSEFGLWTSYFAEFWSYGNGASSKARVPWSHQITDVNVAHKYQLPNLIQGTTWVPNTKFPYNAAAL